MTILQNQQELEKWHRQPDPWTYEENPEDIKRKQILLSEIPPHPYDQVLDIGCGQGFITRDLPGQKIIGIDISHEAINKAKCFENDRIVFKQSSLFELSHKFDNRFDLIILTGILYPQYIGRSLNLVYQIVDELLTESGILISVHIDAWYSARFPYVLLRDYIYNYREYIHKLETYCK